MNRFVVLYDFRAARILVSKAGTEILNNGLGLGLAYTADLSAMAAPREP